MLANDNFGIVTICMDCFSKLSYDAMNSASFSFQFYGDTPLHSAVSGGPFDIVQLLLARADIDPKKENKVRDDGLYIFVNLC